jgi:hypothetical protein
MIAGKTTRNIAGKTTEIYVVEHAPCPKFRILMPLLESWRADEYESKAKAHDAWRCFVRGLAASIGRATCSHMSPGFIPPEASWPKTARASSSSAGFDCRGPSRLAMFSERNGQVLLIEMWLRLRSSCLSQLVSAAKHLRLLSPAGGGRLSVTSGTRASRGRPNP